MRTRRDHSQSTRKGAALLAVLMASAIFGVIIASIMNGTLTEIRVNDRHIARLKAKGAAESAIEYGAADLASRFVRNSSFPLTELQPGNRPLSIPDGASSFFSGTDVDTASMAIWGGIIPPGTWAYIDPNDPSNEFDPMRGRRVYLRNVILYGKGSAKASGGDLINAYTTEKFSVRDAPLFANAIFYNSTLEINSGTDMDVEGPVHTNGDMYVGSKSTATLKFHDKVTATGGIIHDELVDVHIGDGSNVLFTSSTDPEVLRGMKVLGSVLDATSSSWVGDASSRWNGYVQDGAFGVGPQNVVSFEDYVPDNYYTAANEKKNHGYALIEPVLPVGHVDRKTRDQQAQKFAYKAGLILKVEYDATETPGTAAYYKIKGYKYTRSSETNPLSSPTTDVGGNFILTEVVLPNDLMGDPNSAMTDIESPHPEMYELSPATTTTTTEEYYDWRSRKWRTRTVTTTVPGGVTGGLYDHREDEGIDIVALDVGKLEDIIETNNTGIGGFDGTYDVTKDWNGVVYVEFPTSTTESGDGSFSPGSSLGRNSYHIVPGALDDMALMIIDAKEIPEPAGVAHEGLTIATNAPVYTVGSFNANGSAHTNDSTIPDDLSEKPAAIIGDVITVLSNEWPSHRIYSDKANVENYRDVNNFVEISAALISGTPNTIPSDATHGNVSGDTSRRLSLGVVNLPRFLEYWSGETLTIRGSMVSMYESELRPYGAPSDFNDYYYPPIRDWGFNNLLANGAFPPGTPLVRTYRRLNFKEIDRHTYDAAITALAE